MLQGIYITIIKLISLQFSLNYNVNETAAADKNIYLHDSNINSKGHLVFIAEFGSRSFSKKVEFQNYITEIFNNYNDSISGINFRYDDWP